MNIEMLLQVLQQQHNVDFTSPPIVNNVLSTPVKSMPTGVIKPPEIFGKTLFDKPVQSQEVQNHIDGKENVSNVSSTRLYNRTYKQNRDAMNAPQKEGVPSLFEQQQKINRGETLLARKN